MQSVPVQGPMSTSCNYMLSRTSQVRLRQNNNNNNIISIPINSIVMRLKFKFDPEIYKYTERMQEIGGHSLIYIAAK